MKLDWAMEDILPSNPFASLSEEMVPFVPQTLEGQCIMLAYEFLKNSAKLSPLYRDRFVLFIRDVVLSCASILQIDDMYIRMADGSVTGSDKCFHTDGAPKGTVGDYYTVLVTLGNAPGTQLVNPSESTKTELRRLAKRYQETADSIRSRGWDGTFLDQPELVEIERLCDEVIPQSEIVDAQPYQCAFMRNSEPGKRGSAGSTWHRAPKGFTQPRGLLLISGKLL